MIERQSSGRLADGDREALNRLLGVPGMAWFVARVRGRILAAGDEPLSGVVQLNEPTAEQRAGAMRLVGRAKRAGSTLRVDLADAEEILRRGPWPAGLADAVETLTGPVVDRRAERAREAAEWVAARDGLAPVAVRFPGLIDWWNEWCAAGGLKRAARAEAVRNSGTPSPVVGADLVSKLAAVLEILPASGEPIALLSRRAVGDAHGLDASRPLGRLAATVARAAFMPDVAIADGEFAPPRDAWAAAGVVLSNLASTVLCLGVPGISPTGAGTCGQSPRAATATSLEAMRAARMPVLLTLEQVRSGGVRAAPRGSVIHICENPTVVEVVAGRWAQSTAGASGVDSPVLVCTSGQPSTAVVELLKRLAGDGAECRYHGDFDWAGLRIARYLSEQVAWVPWRFSAADYREAAESGMPSRRLLGNSAESPWDPELAIAMTECGLAVEEEAVTNLLAQDVLVEKVS
ncbi:TIGR02679 family protein [uncultured Arthrobacter sp.]|uniref:TIGR02679 family protein n=1 Tax=uncultured Arthrobacter sp. TaxID=114050 RepID=UPI002612ABA7|nr:TIGR02679 family protein [uncultured Arthrobacter sp.]